MPRAWFADHRKLAEPTRWVDVNPGPRVTSERYMTGGWEKRDPHENPHFQELAHYAVSKGSKPKRYYDTVVTLIEVYTQLVAGVNYRLNYTYANTGCRTDQEYKPSKCRPKGKVRGWCKSIVYEMPWEHILVAGVNYRLNYTYANTGCRTDQEYKPSKCRPKGKVRGWCKSIVYEMPWEHIVHLSQHQCSSF
ncbi:putative cystatin [Ixodes scapularis]